MILHAKRRLLIISFVALGFCLSGQLRSVDPASALTVTRSSTHAEPLSFGTDPFVCSGFSGDRFALPRAAFGIQARSPRIGTTFNSGRVHIAYIFVETRRGVPVVEWVATGTSSFCSGYSGDGWQVDTTGVVDFKQHVRISLNRRLGRQLAISVLNGHFEDTFENATRILGFSCKKRTGRLLRCRVAWFLGDSSYRGKVSIALGATPRTPLWSYRLRVAVTDEHCVYVAHGSNCRKVVRRQRKKLRLGWKVYDSFN